jgi:UDP-N-acetylglucosamine 2-epimerase (non-hydrolysing)
MTITRVMTVFGTRPEAIKLAPVIKAFESEPQVENITVATAQHREILDQVLSLFKIQPDVDLNLMTEDQPLAALTTSIIENLDPVLENYAPEWLILQGDTTTVLGAALAAYYRKIRVGHLEAGLRTGDKWQPFPEEINRRVASVIADVHFAPTTWAYRNLLREGVSDRAIHVTGNTIMDTLQMVTKLPPPPAIERLLEEKQIGADGKDLVLITAHRRENFGEPLQNICAALEELASQFHDRVEIVYPVHPNPNVKKIVRKYLDGIPNITLLPPQEYLPMVHLEKNARLILTDSGGIQEEATGLGIPCLVLRELTERPEGVEAGILKLVGTNTGNIVKEAAHLLLDQDAREEMAKARNPYGDGMASHRIVKTLLSA